MEGGRRLEKSRARLRGGVRVGGENGVSKG